jgi:hypothetical protein
LTLDRRVRRRQFDAHSAGCSRSVARCCATCPDISFCPAALLFYSLFAVDISSRRSFFSSPRFSRCKIVADLRQRAKESWPQMSQMFADLGELQVHLRKSAISAAESESLTLWNTFC